LQRELAEFEIELEVAKALLGDVESECSAELAVRAREQLATLQREIGSHRCNSRWSRSAEQDQEVREIALAPSAKKDGKLAKASS